MSIATTAKRQSYSTLAVLGTRWIMFEDFYTGRLEARGIKSLGPDEATCLEIDQIIWDALALGVFKEYLHVR